MSGTVAARRRSDRQVSALVWSAVWVGSEGGIRCTLHAAYDPQHTARTAHSTLGASGAARPSLDGGSAAIQFTAEAAHWPHDECSAHG